MLIVFLLPFSMFFQKVLSLIKKKEHSKLFKFLILFWLRWVFTALCGLLIAVASLTAELGSRVCGLQQPWPVDSLIAVPGLQSTGSMLWHMGSGAL